MIRRVDRARFFDDPATGTEAREGPRGEADADAARRHLEFFPDYIGRG